MRTGLWSLLLVATLISPVSLWGQQSGEAKRIRISLPSRSTTFFPMLMAQKHGFFRDEGLFLEPIVMRPSFGMQAMIAGEIDFITVPGLTIRAAIAGVPVLNVMAFTSGPTHSLVARPEIRTMQDLKGKVIGTSDPRGLLDEASRKALIAHGLKPDVDTTFLVVGRSGDRLAALQAGRIHATFLNPPLNKRALKAGFRELLFLKSVMKVHTGGLSATLERIKEDPDSIVRTIRASLRGTSVMQKDKGEFLELFRKESGIKDEGVGNQVYNDLRDLYSLTGIASEASMVENVDIARRMLGVTRKVSMSDIADWSFARKASEGLK